jgi:hypothetical protein
MLKRWSIDNFKSFCDKTDLDFSAINVFAGANNSGKSTIIQSILLLKQTLQYAPANRPIALNGPLLKLGRFDDIKNRDGKAPYIGFSWSLDIDQPARSVHLSNYTFGSFPFFYWGPEQITSTESEIRFEVTAETDVSTLRHERSPQIAQLQPNLSFVSLSARLKAGPESAQATRIVLTRSKTQGGLDLPAANGITSRSRAESVRDYDVVDIDEQSMQELFDKKPDAKLIGASVRHFLPLQVGILFDAGKRKARIISELICADSYYSFAHMGVQSGEYAAEIIPEEVVKLLDVRMVGPARRQILREQLYVESEAHAPIRLSSLMDALRRARMQLLRDSRTQNRPPLSLADLQPQVEAILLNDLQPMMTVDVEVPNRVISGSEYARFFFSFAVRYLGPLRDEPRPIYPLEALLNPTEVGYKGEHTAAVLHLHRDTYIQYVPSAFVQNLDKTPASITTTLHAAVVDWLAYMGVIEEFTTEDLGKIGHNLQVQTQGNPELYDLTNVGVGVSQVLPIVVMALLAERPCF